MLKRLNLSQEMELYNKYLKHIWHFYAVYNISLNILGVEDNEAKKKNIIFRSLQKNFTRKKYNQMLNYIKKDYATVERAINLIKEKEDQADIIGDIYQPGMLAVSEDDDFD